MSSLGAALALQSGGTLGAGEDITDELLGLLSRWLFNPIRSDDAGYVQALKDNMNSLVSNKQAGGWFSRSMKRFFA